MNLLEYASKHKKLLGLLLVAGLGLSVCAGGQDSWKEEVLLHDGSALIVERSQRYGGRHEIGQSLPIKEHTIRFKLPRSSQVITWVSEYGDDIQRANFNLLALHVLNGTPYVVASPNLCLSYNKWGRPNPPYVIFKYDGKSWQRISMQQFPNEFKTLNVAIYLGSKDVEAMVSQGLVSAEKIKTLNSKLRQPEFKTILRVPLAIVHERCGEMVYDGKGGWHGIGWFNDNPTGNPTRSACLDYCKVHQISAAYCPCNTLFNKD